MVDEIIHVYHVCGIIIDIFILLIKFFIYYILWSSHCVFNWPEAFIIDKTWEWYCTSKFCYVWFVQCTAEEIILLSIAFFLVLHMTINSCNTKLKTMGMREEGGVLIRYNVFRFTMRSLYYPLLHISLISGFAGVHHTIAFSNKLSNAL